MLDIFEYLRIADIHCTNIHTYICMFVHMYVHPLKSLLFKDALKLFLLNKKSSLLMKCPILIKKSFVVVGRCNMSCCNVPFSGAFPHTSHMCHLVCRSTSSLQTFYKVSTEPPQSCQFTYQRELHTHAHMNADKYVLMYVSMNLNIWSILYM